ncbi:isoprenoid synthase domain-containing protein [Massariosphaeria phaeospora]|uniref:geranylgeranyl diphosphate synthase n=1 Tax=Massariosphaeria phaeospora TaxID=100035 RepID=A0A7C8I7T5_9PLEO|nr:isoprenoid synthase domain-containing protein [Massariosphaeria phaeospora]
MEYQHSVRLLPGQYQTEGLCDGLSVRKHVAEDLEEIGTFNAQEDWRNLVAPMSNYKGGLGPKHSFMAVSLPECLPDRFEIVSYANEFAFLHDEGNIENDAVLAAFHEGARNGKIDALKSGKRQMQAKILNTMMSIDRPRALNAMRAWAIFVEQGAGRQHHYQFQTLEDYLPYRSKDVGHMFWHALVTFGCAITIPEEELGICSELVQSAVIAASLTNDLFSYEKEYEAAQAAGLPNVVNALWVLMGEYDISLEEAKARCRTRIKEEVARYASTVEETITRNDLSSDAKRYIELMQYSVSGNVVWSLQCPRYHKGMQYNERQLLRERHGISKYPTTFQLIGQKKRTRSGSVGSVVVEDTFTSGKKTKTGIYSHQSDEIIRASVFPMDSTSKSPEEERDWDVIGLARGTPLPRLGEELVLEPYRYVSCLPSKGVRDMAVDSINLWLCVSPQFTETIRSIIKVIHNSSIMLDDLQDGSQLRRGSPSAHTIFGEAQTINSATFQYVLAIAELRKLPNPLCLDIFIDEMRSLFVGQGFELHWTNAVQCPSVVEYLQMVDGKTGGLFRLLARLMAAESPHGGKADTDRLCRLLGRYFQIRDDYQNLVSEEYMAQKGFCEDLDEGKFSLPLVHALAHTHKGLQLRALLRQRRQKGQCTLEQKHLILALMRGAGSMKYTLQVLQALHTELEGEVGRLEGVFGQVNHEIRLMLAVLKV